MGRGPPSIRQRRQLEAVGSPNGSSRTEGTLELNRKLVVIEIIAIYHSYLAKMGGNARMAMLTDENEPAWVET